MDIDKKDLGQRIKEIRLNKGANLREFGEIIASKLNEKPISDSIVSRWEKGVSKPNPKRLKIIAEIGGISVEKLLYGSLYNFIYLNIDKFSEFIRVDTTVSKHVLANFITNNITTYKSNLEIQSKINNQKEYTELSYSDSLYYALNQFPKQLEQIKKNGKLVVEALKNKDTDVLQKHNDIILVDKILNGEEISLIDLIKEYYFVLMFPVDNFQFEDEYYDDIIGKISYVLSKYFIEKDNSTSLVNNLNNDDLKKLKSNSIDLANLLETDFSFHDAQGVYKDLIKIFKDKVPKQLDHKIHLHNIINDQNK
ncbi:helix-turn-helix transcriptional regulator [Staphylococcus saprophyticus]|uniref:helix-turn-helix domain-containing protein n=1 Tax=Staphylococcus saprophyticus TaxID=29385 RepID=UPI000B60CD26|nr:helix-turn-helix transcriptional regulator [Staphylococcus saprophyticus]ASE58067.1 hypothetical protein CEQ14_02020 [Staphylococcus saprophyticus]MDW3860660.1 helix-turn-helix transcriptional regulator [Staphylococcus saprophyticus]MDW3870389.1 helix-turn-helix transcriptional regulator [Staphylococcus saprophyticus]MDW4110026.1 helix-turn-helix transcriptional regulator [Staphylococcus saprophyticus]MDW4163892.1 helix-turn-helix transcriptional regulator [Staphylococcus saprophyticus]